jgi:hypothetical protein
MEATNHTFYEMNCPVIEMYTILSGAIRSKEMIREEMIRAIHLPSTMCTP